MKDYVGLWWVPVCLLSDMFLKVFYLMLLRVFANPMKKLLYLV